MGHPSPGAQFPSVTSIVYSWDQYAAKYAAATGIQHPRQEIIEGLKEYLKTAITNFVRANGVPTCIFFFRDGVSEGEYLTVAKEEKDQLRGQILCALSLLGRLTSDCSPLAAIEELWQSSGETKPKPKITFVVVTKR